MLHNKAHYNQLTSLLLKDLKDKIDPTLFTICPLKNSKYHAIQITHDKKEQLHL